LFHLFHARRFDRYEVATHPRAAITAGRLTHVNTPNALFGLNIHVAVRVEATAAAQVQCR
jgi:hypothetical protein